MPSKLVEPTAEWTDCHAVSLSTGRSDSISTKV